MERKSCPGCNGWYAVNKDGRLRAHKKGLYETCDQGSSKLFYTPVSDPAPTVEETTTQGDDVADKGPWFGAMYTSECSECDGAIYEGDRIRADGTGGYECEDCGDPYLGGEPPSDWQAQASAAARRHVEGVRPTVEIRDEAQEFLAPGRGMANLTDTAQYVAQWSRPMPTVEEFLFEDPAPPAPGVPVMTADEFMDPAVRDVKPVLNVSGQPDANRDWQKRYVVVDPDLGDFRRAKNGNKQGVTRTTTFVKAASDNKAINDWGKRNVVIGAARRRDLLLQANGLTHELDRDKLNSLVLELEEAAGAKVGSELGTFLHEFTEYMDAGLKTWRDAPEQFQRSLALYSQALANAGLEPVSGLIERTVFIREFGGVCGTFDRVFLHRPSGTYVIGDLKTGKTLKYGVNEFCAQLWTYAHGINQHGVYDWNTDSWDRPWEGLGVPNTMAPLTAVREDVGVIVHMPVQGPDEGSVSLHWADLEAGAKHAELCHAVRSAPKVKARPWGDGPARGPEPWHDQGGGLWVRHSMTPVPSPEPKERVWEHDFRTVASGEQATELWRQAKQAGITGVRLNELIELARTSIREHAARVDTGS
jgi:hypothetical protein